MDKVQMNFDFLARETFALTEEMMRQRLLKESRDSSEKLSIRKIKNPLPIGTGIVYYPEFGGSTFCIRGVAVDNIKEAFESIDSGDMALRKKLKLSSEKKGKLFYFQTPSNELSQMIYKQMINKRMLFQEEIVCNISDPGFSWWMDISAFGFKVFFKSYGLKKTENYIKLGPIGDRVVVVDSFKKILPYLDQYIDFSEFSIDESSLSIKVKSPKNEHYLKLRELFMFGNCENLFEDLPQNKFGNELYDYFHEIETLRSFWLKIEEKLALEQILK